MSLVQRVFQIGAASIQDPCSALPFDKAFEMLCKTHPQVRHTQMFESDGQFIDGKIVYVVPVLPPKTNG